MDLDPVVYNLVALCPGRSLVDLASRFPANKPEAVAAALTRLVEAGHVRLAAGRYYVVDEPVSATDDAADSVVADSATLEDLAAEIGPEPPGPLVGGALLDSVGLHEEDARVLRLKIEAALGVERDHCRTDDDLAALVLGAREMGNDPPDRRQLHALRAGLRALVARHAPDADAVDGLSDAELLAQLGRVATRPPDWSAERADLLADVERLETERDRYRQEITSVSRVLDAYGAHGVGVYVQDGLSTSERVAVWCAAAVRR